MDKIILKISGKYRTKRDSIMQLVNDISIQLYNLDPIDIKEDSLIDLSELKYIDSNISVILYSFIKFLINATPASISLIMPDNQELKKVFLKNNFSKLWGADAKIDTHDTIMKITETKNIKETTIELQNCFLPKLNKIFSKGYQYEFISSLAEVCQNSFIHGNAKNVYFCGQFYPKLHKLCITIINFGNTFQENVISYMKEKNMSITDYKFISWAFIESNTTDDNSSGIGLARFMDLIKYLNADLILLSGNEIYSYEKGKERDEFNPNLYIGGTIINIKFNLNENNFI